MSGKELFTEDSELKRDLGLTETVSIVISRIIGSGIFRTPGPIMLLAGSTGVFGIVWLIAGIVTILCAAIYGELVAMMPKSGGPYVFIKEAYGPLWAFLRGWSSFFVSETGAIAAVAIVFAEYTASFIGILSGESLSSFQTLSLALLSVWLLTASNLFGVYLSGKVQNFFSSIKIAALGVIIGISFTSKGSWMNFTSPLWNESFGCETILAVGAAMRYAFFAFSGWEGATYVAEEVKNPRRNLPLSMFLGITGVILLYIGVNAAYIYQIPVDAIKNSRWVAVDAMKAAIGSAGGILISAAVMMNTFGNISTQILVKARSWQAMARDGLFFEWIKELHPVYKTPNHSLIAQGVWASVLLLFASLSKNSYEAILDFFAATGTVFNIMTFSSIYYFRKKYPDAVRPYKAMFYPASLVLVLLIYTAFFVITLITAFVPSVIGIGLTSTGLIYYYFLKNR